MKEKTKIPTLGEYLGEFLINRYEKLYRTKGKEAAEESLEIPGSFFDPKKREVWTQEIVESMPKKELRKIVRKTRINFIPLLNSMSEEYHYKNEEDRNTLELNRFWDYQTYAKIVFCYKLDSIYNGLNLFYIYNRFGESVDKAVEGLRKDPVFKAIR